MTISRYISWNIFLLNAWLRERRTFILAICVWWKYILFYCEDTCWPVFLCYYDVLTEILWRGPEREDSGYSWMEEEVVRPGERRNYVVWLWREEMWPSVVREGGPFYSTYSGDCILCKVREDHVIIFPVLLLHSDTMKRRDDDCHLFCRTEII